MIENIRCVGGYLDNVVVTDHGETFQVLDYTDYAKMAKLPKGDPRLNNSVKYHNYTKRNGEYIHDEDCCELKSIRDFR